jgi:hypothetical protein
VEEEWTRVSPQWTQGRLKDLIGEAVADLDPAAARDRVGMVAVPCDVERVVILAVAVDDDASLARHPAHQPHQIEVIAELQIRRPLEDEDDGVGRLDV